MAATKTKGGGYKTDKPWRDALRIAAFERGPSGEKKLRIAAEKLVDAAMDGDVAALKELGDRLDGKAHQSIGGEGGGALKIEVITGVPRAED